MATKRKKEPEDIEIIETAEPEVIDAEIEAEASPASGDGKLRDLEDRHLRLLAEYENYRRRTAKEKQDTYDNAKLDTIAEYLPLYDNLLRAAAQPCADENFAKGINMLVKQFEDILEKLRVTEIPALGEQFDPEVHNAIQHIDDENAGAQEVVEVFAAGFKTDKRVLRPAIVKVAN